MTKELKRIKVLEDELALLKADLMGKEKQPIEIDETLTFLVHPIELGCMTWEEAKLACGSLGEGWRLPTRVELLLMYENKDVLGVFTSLFYWSSTESYSNNAWIQSFFNGNQNYIVKDAKFYVRAVKTI